MQLRCLNEELTVWESGKENKVLPGEVPQPKIRIPVRSREVPGLSWTQSWAECLLPARKGV